MSSFTHPQVVPNLYEFLSSAEHKRRHFEEWVTSWWTPLTSGKKMDVINCLVAEILQNIFCVQQKNENHSGNNLRARKW